MSTLADMLKPQSLVTALRLWLSRIIFLFAVLWLGYLLWGNVAEIRRAATVFSCLQFSVATVFATLALFMASVTYYLLMVDGVGKVCSFSECAGPYLYAQIARYLPGKIWSLIYQAREMSSYIDARSIWELNFSQFIIGAAMSGTAILGVFIDRFYGHTPAIIAAILMVFMLFIVLKKRLFQVFVRAVADKLPVSSAGIKRDTREDNALKILLSLLFDWAFYLLSWSILLHSFYSAYDAMIIAVLYVASWLVGFLVIVLPGGLLVRESTFIGLTTMLGYDVGYMTFLAILGRILFSLADIANVLVAYVVFKKK